MTAETLFAMAREAEDNATGIGGLARGSPTRPGRSPLAAVDRLLLRLVDAGLAGAIFAVPLLMGGRQPLGQFVLVALAVWVAGCWCLRQGLAGRAAWVRSPADLLLLAAPALVALQLVTLPPAVLEVFSPQLFKTLPLWAPQNHAAGSLGVWNTLSLTPAATRRALVLVAAITLLLGTTLQRVRRLEDVERLIRWIACSVAIEAVFALVEYFMSNGKFFWFYEHPFASTKNILSGSFPNPNHFAQFLALGIAPWIWWMQQGLESRNRQPAAGRFGFAPSSRRVDARTAGLAVVLGVVVFAGLMSRSRGGIMAIAVAAGTCLLVLYRHRLIRPKTFLAGIGIGVFVLTGLFIYGYQPVATELDDFGSLTTLDRNAGRRRLWMANLRGLADYPLAGTGAGSHRDVIPIYFHDESMSRVEYTHAENSYVQIGLEAGVPGALLMLCAVGLCGYWCLASLRRRLPRRTALAFAAIAPGLAANFAHAMADFIWYVPACTVLVVVLAACACRLWQFAGRPGEKSVPACRASRAVWLAAAACLAITGGFMLKNRFAAVRAESSWHRYVLLNQSLEQHGTTRASLATLETMAGQLTDVVRWQPDRGRAHARLAEIHLALFEQAVGSQSCPFNVKQVREAALASRFESPGALRAWLGRAFAGRWEHLEAAWRHARLAARDAPLEADAYLRLGDVSFFEGPGAAAKNAYIRQALLVRPFDGEVLFEAGQEAVLTGDWGAAFARWKQSYRTSAIAQKRIEQFLAGKIPVATFVAIFQPDLAALRRLSVEYGKLDRPEEVRAVLRLYAAAAQSHARSLKGPEAAEAWLQAAGAFQKLEDPAERLRCLRGAVASDPGHYDARHALGTCLLKMGRAAEAEGHLEWCVQWRPRDKAVRAELEAAMDQRLRMGSRPDAQQPTR